jgi:alkanesulfonate monooxygenase SsuD/methylene tetrahydromethanopterin reductase-like flavin-dependent oxidoreductase (luciferase family)
VPCSIAAATIADALMRDTLAMTESTGRPAGAQLGFGVVAGLGRELLTPLTTALRDLGYTSFWTNDSARPDADGLVTLAMAHDAAPTLELGVGVLPLDRRPPESIVAEIDRLDLPLAALRIGVGSGTSTRPLETVRAGVAELRELLPGARIFVAALGPKMCALAGEIADGVLFNWASPDRLVRANAWVSEGEAAAGRPRSERWSYIRATLGDDARERLGAEARRYSRMPGYGKAFAAQHVAFDTVGIAGDDLAGQLAPYRELLDGAVVRALPAEWDFAQASAIAQAAVGAGRGPD